MYQGILMVILVVILGGDVLKNSLNIVGIRDDDWMNPFGATEAELLASALDTSGLLTKSTMINGISAWDAYQSYCKKRKQFQQSINLGNTLVKHLVLSQAHLRQALDMQKENQKPLIDILLEEAYCNEAEIKEALDDGN